jgi:hypothetical protein
VTGEHAASNPATEYPAPCPIFRKEEGIVAEQIDLGWVYDLTPLKTFWMVNRLEHLTEQARHLGLEQYSVLELREREGLFRYIHRRQFTADGVRSRMFSGPPMLTWNKAWQQPDWDGSRHFNVDVEITGVPVRIIGDGGIQRIGAGGTRYSVSLRIETTGRLGGTLTPEKIAESLATTLKGEHEFRALWIERQSHSGF